jgi:hypothetical protein
VFLLALIVALHLLFALMLRSEMQPARASRDQTLVVRLLDDTRTPRTALPPAPPAPPELASPQQAAAPRVRPKTPEKPRREAMTVQDHAASPAQVAPAPAAPAASPAHINAFVNNGTVKLPPASTSAPAAPTAQAKPAESTDDRQIMQHTSSYPAVKPTRFDKYFPPPNETAGGAVGRHVDNAIKAITKSLCDPTKRSTASNLLCGSPPIPPSPKNADERLNLPPASLVGDPNPVTLPLSTCIAEYTDGKSLSQGCPINTPELAFKAEMRVCIDLYRAGKRLKTWCPADTPQRAAAESAAPAASASAGAH